MKLDAEFKGIVDRFSQRKNLITSDFAEAIKAHTDKAFREEGYSKSAYTRWQKKKRYDGFKILHQSNTLSSSTYIARKTWPTIIVRNDIFYGDYHNEDQNSDHVPERHFMDDGPGKSPILDRKLDLIMRRHMNYILNG